MDVRCQCTGDDANCKCQCHNCRKQRRIGGYPGKRCTNSVQDPYTVQENPYGPNLESRYCAACDLKNEGW